MSPRVVEEPRRKTFEVRLTEREFAATREEASRRSSDKRGGMSALARDALARVVPGWPVEAVGDETEAARSPGGHDPVPSRPEASKASLGGTAAGTPSGDSVSPVDGAVRSTDAPPGGDGPAQVGYSSVPELRFGCPDSSCDRRFGSIVARCPVHGRKAVPA